MADSKPIRFIDEEIEVHFDQPPVLEKKPGCPDDFTWQGWPYSVVEMLDAMVGFHAAGEICAQHDTRSRRKGEWFLYREMSAG